MIYLIRHTAPDVEPGICYGQSDVPLAASYRQELMVLRRKLAGIQPRHCFSSPSARCQRLAHDLCPGDVTTDPRLLELNFGDWEQKRWDELDPKQAAHWGDHFVTVACPGGESFSDLYDRVMDFWKELPAKSGRGDSFIVTHGGVIRTIIAELTDTPLAQAFAAEVPYGHIIPVDTSGARPTIATKLPTGA